MLSQAGGNSERTSVQKLTPAAPTAAQYLVKDQIHDSGCTLKVIGVTVLLMSVFMARCTDLIPALLKISGFSTGEIAVSHRPRSTASANTTETDHQGFSLDMISSGSGTVCGPSPASAGQSLGSDLASAGSGLWRLVVRPGSQTFRYIQHPAALHGFVLHRPESVVSDAGSDCRYADQTVLWSSHRHAI